MKILTEIILYNPDLNRLRENIEAVRKQCDSILLIDNASINKTEVKKMLDECPVTDVIWNETNRGVSAALKQAMHYGMEHGYDWVLTLDQDSVCRNGLIKAYQKFGGLDHAGILTCIVDDRNYQKTDQFAGPYREVESCITSGSFMNVEAYRHTDGFDEKMIIDLVDYDICFNMHAHGYKVYQINYHGLLHELGRGKPFTFLGKKYTVLNESAQRHYYIARNQVYLMHKYPDYVSWKRCLVKEAKYEVKILFLETDKWNKLISRWKGMKDGVKMAE